MENPEIPFVFRLPSDWTFFGLTPRYKVQVTEQIFDLVFHSKGAFSYTEATNLPIYLRVFYIKRLQKHFKEQKKEHDKAMKKSKANARRPSPKKPPRISRR